jgi:hypothetical protein
MRMRDSRLNTFLCESHHSVLFVWSAPVSALVHSPTVKVFEFANSTIPDDRSFIRKYLIPVAFVHCARRPSTDQSGTVVGKNETVPEEAFSCTRRLCRPPPATTKRESNRGHVLLRRMPIAITRRATEIAIMSRIRRTPGLKCMTVRNSNHSTLHGGFEPLIDMELITAHGNCFRVHDSSIHDQTWID